MKKILICGAGGFIGGHLASKFIQDKTVELICADIKPPRVWLQKFPNAKNYSVDLKDFAETQK